MAPISRDTISAGESTIFPGVGNGVVLVGLEPWQPHRLAARKKISVAVKREATLALHSLCVAVVGKASMLCGRIQSRGRMIFQQVAGTQWFDALLQCTLE
jgi:hypothetical protein